MSGGLVLPFALAGAAPERRRRSSRGAAAAGAPSPRYRSLAFGPHLPGLETQSALVTPLSPQNLVGLVLGQGGATGPCARWSGSGSA